MSKAPQEAWQQLLNEKDETIASLKEENEALKKNAFDSVFEWEKEARAQQRYILELQERIRVLGQDRIRALELAAHVTAINVGDIPTPSKGQEKKEEGWNLASGIPKMVNERMSERVICYTTWGNITIGHTRDGVWIYEVLETSFEAYGDTVTHWRYLPAPPNSERSDLRE
jgi:hypothetical protein